MSRNTPSPGGRLLVIISMALAYFVVAKAGQALSIYGGSTPLVWPAAGLAVGAMLLRGTWLWPGVALGSFAASVAADVPLLYAVVTGLVNALAPGIGVVLLERGGFDRRMSRILDVLLFFVIAVLASSLAGAFLGGIVRFAVGLSTLGAAPTVGLAWWLSDATGILTVAPLLIVWASFPPRRWSAWQLAEATILVSLVLLISQLIYGGWIGNASDQPLSFAVFPFVIWAAIRFGPRGTMTVIVVALSIAVWGTVNGHGPFVQDSIQRSAVFLQTFIASVTMAGLILGAAIEERRSAEEELRASRENLEREVVQRTRQLQEELAHGRKVQESLNRYEFIVNASSELMTLINREFRYEAVNDWFCIAMNKNREDVIGRTVAEVWGEETFHRTIRANIERALGGEEVHYQSWFPYPGTGERCIDVRYTPYRNAESAITHVVVVSWDVTERERAEEQVRKLSRAVEQSPVSIVITDLKGTIEYVNPRFELVTGYLRQEAIGRNPRILKSGERPPEDYQHLWTTISEGGEWHGEFHNKKKNGELFWEFASISGIRNADGALTHYLAVKEDITERKRLERELEQLVYVTSHDLRSPLVNIQGFSKELERAFVEIRDHLNAVQKTPDPRITELLESDVPEAFGYIYASTRKMDALIDGLLRLSRLGRGTLSIRPIDMQALMTGVLQTLEYRIQQQQVSVTVGLLPPCCGDEMQINQLFSNLLDNALKYLDPRRPGRIAVHGETAGGMVAYTVEDNGIGIAPEHTERIFELFHRLHPTMVEGEGLGLTVARKIVDRHGGTIRVSSVPDQGTVFTVSLSHA